jgi:hypothetical protein
MNKCRVCSSERISKVFTGNVLKNIKVDYFECEDCEYLQTEEPHWLLKAYETPINIFDTGVMVRSKENLRSVIATLILTGNKKGIVLDDAGGYGILVRMLRDFGVSAYWNDPYCENLVSRGFEFSGGKVDLLTAFEVFEHLTNPLDKLKEYCSKSPSVLISTLLLDQKTPPLDKWWYYGLEHGQHIGFFREKTLRVMADKCGKRLVTDGRSLHLFCDSRHSNIKWRLIRRMLPIFECIKGIGLKSKTLEDQEYLKINERN